MSEARTYDPSERVKVRCARCHSRLCDRVHISSGWTLHFRNRGWEVFSTEMAVTCGNCKTMTHITNDGILECLTL